jgi:hypothetical protein
VKLLVLRSSSAPDVAYFTIRHEMPYHGTSLVNERRSFKNRKKWKP